MQYQLLELLSCPNCRHDFNLTEIKENNGEIERAELICSGCTKQYPIVRFIPRFVSTENYASNFGFQWNRFRKTQLDSYTGVTLSRERFFCSTGWSADELAGRKVLDVGCGAGRFAEVALSCGANLVALDYSSSVDACWNNLSPQQGLNVVQGDIYHLPFKSGVFDFVYCLGVLQHTPDVRRAFMALPEQLKERGKLTVDVYPRLLLNIVWPKYWLRPFTKRIPVQSLFRLVEAMVRYLLPISFLIGRTPFIGRKLRYAIPVVNYDGIFPLSKAQLREWAILDTFDMLSAQHDHPQSLATLFSWFEQGGLQNIEVFRRGFYIGRGVKKL